MMDHASIKQLARQLKCRATDLIALAEKNDPFYAGLGWRERDARWFAGLWKEYGWSSGMHLRRVHYILISRDKPLAMPDGRPYINTLDCSKSLGTASLTARYLKLIPGNELVDRRNPDPVIHAQTGRPVAGAPVVIGVQGYSPIFDFDLPEISDDDDVGAPYLSVMSFTDGQPFLVEIWCEKTTMDDVLVPLARKYGCNYVPGMGETSEIQCRLAVERAIDAGRPMRIIYASDFDPAGRSMPVGLARKIEFLVRDAGLDLDITLQPVLLTPEQCVEYRLPRTPLKEGEGRGAKFQERFGEGATELDALEALHPGEFRKIVEREIQRYVDPTLGSRCEAERWSLRRQLDELTAEVHESHDLALIEERYSQIRENVRAAIDQAKVQMDQLEEDAAPIWRAIAAELDELRPGIEVEPVVARDADPPARPLFDSKRSYLEQIDNYRVWQGRDGQGRKE